MVIEPDGVAAIPDISSLHDGNVNIFILPGAERGHTAHQPSTQDEKVGFNYFIGYLFQFFYHFWVSSTISVRKSGGFMVTQRSSYIFCRSSKVILGTS